MSRPNVILNEACVAPSEPIVTLSEAKSLTRSFAALRATQEDKEGRDEG